MYSFALDLGWEFRRLDPKGGSTIAWSKVNLPHIPFVADLDGREHWFGECEYRRSLSWPTDAPIGRCTLFVGAAMHSATVAVDDTEVARHTGGFLPFEVDLSHSLRSPGTHTLTLRLDNRDNPDVPPGKPFADLDFCWYGGLYRNAELRCYPPLCVTDAIGAGAVASGGIFIRTLAASPDSALLSIQTHAANTGAHELEFSCEIELFHEGRLVAQGRSSALHLAAGASTAISLEIRVAQPALWSIESPFLHVAHVTLRATDGAVADVRSERFGIRRIGFSRSGGFTLNGRRLRLRGTNRHQEYPCAGYAVPAAAQRRDARLIKEAGFDYVRLSHYPQSPDFLNACDELGIIVMNCIPGWQFIGGDRFQAACEQNTRELVRRDRNHPCVVLWELSLNETAMDEPFMARMHRAGHEEYPGDQFFSSGWLDCYDVYIHSRQHGKIHEWKNADKALVVAEYGDWEFYASNQGFDQKTGAGVYAAWSHGRQRRINGERGLRQQTMNHIIALNDTLSSPAVLDGQWCMFDYARGYARERAACGIMDIFRLPKFSFYFYRSQRDPAEQGTGWTSGPLVSIASHWTPASDLRVVVFSNCEEVEFQCNGRSIERQHASKTWMTQYLPHPPFVFELAAFEAGEIFAVGFIAGQPVASHRVITPRSPVRLTLEIVTGQVKPADNASDLLIAHARIVDSAGVLCVGETDRVEFRTEGDVELIGPAAVTAEAGIASVVIRVATTCASFQLQARRIVSDSAWKETCTWQRHEASEKHPREVQPTT